MYTAGLASLVGYGLFNTLLARNPASFVVPWVLLAPVVAMVSAWLLLDQRPNAAELAGGLMLLAGALVAQRARRPGSESLDPPRRTSPTELRSAGWLRPRRVVTVSTK